MPETQFYYTVLELHFLKHSSFGFEGIFCDNLTNQFLRSYIKYMFPNGPHSSSLCWRDVNESSQIIQGHFNNAKDYFQSTPFR